MLVAVGCWCRHRFALDNSVDIRVETRLELVSLRLANEINGNVGRIRLQPKLIGARARRAHVLGCRWRCSCCCCWRVARCLACTRTRTRTRTQARPIRRTGSRVVVNVGGRDWTWACCGRILASSLVAAVLAVELAIAAPQFLTKFKIISYHRMGLSNDRWSVSLVVILSRYYHIDR